MTTEPNRPSRKRTSTTKGHGAHRDDPRYEGKHVEVFRHDQGGALEDPFDAEITQFVLAGSRSEISVQHLARTWTPTEVESYHQQLIDSHGPEVTADLYWKVWSDEGDTYLRGYFGDLYGAFQDLDDIIAWLERQGYVIIDRRGETA